MHIEVKDRKMPILFFANKMDCKDALSAVKVEIFTFYLLSTYINR